MFNNTEVMVYLHSLEHGHVKVGFNKIPVDSITLSVFDIKLANIQDAHGRLMITLDKGLAESKGLIRKPAPAPTRTIESGAAHTTARMVEQPKPAPKQQHESEHALEADIGDILDSEIAKSTVDMAKKLAPKMGLLAAAGVKRQS